ncbi:peptide/nickel transport system substrate-binding protein [Albimonas donghaensis]|uniref:Peptide/nickel transport system substrate-binding protein n=1 Tax=Albimonas donghaensis TaxID=356660 RepID=A0A1H2TN87_9RHOB|nr:ABC transporter substrate-binding protein [Albimonas donghaensis]SDW45300.1 peptide/nickel transport system substrate-binding protein [Albimonas donghaensis]
MTFPRRLLSLAAGAALLASTALVAPGAQAADRPTITVAVQQIVNAGALDVLREQSNVGARVFYSIYEGLIDFERQTDDLPQKPGLATSWKRIDDRTVELTLREGVKFHNGDVMTAEDVVFTFSPERFGTLPEQVEAQKEGATLFTSSAATATKGKVPPPEVAAVAKRAWPNLDRVEKVDDMTVRFISKVPDPTLEGRISRGGAQILSKRAYQEAATWADFARAPVGTGPYKVVDFRPDNVLVLAAHEDYWGGEPPIKELRFLVVPEVASRVNGLLSGEYDFITDVPPDQIALVEEDPAFEVVGGPITNHRLMVFDKNNGPMKNVKIRQAMTHAIDRELIVDALWGGRTKVPAGLQWEYYGDMYLADWEVPAYDLDLAKKLVAESGYDGSPITVRVLNNYYTNQVSTAQINAEAFRQIGLNIEIEMKENWQQIFDTESGPRMVRDWSNSAPYPDPVSSIVNQHCQNGQQQQVGEWTNEEFNALCIKLETSTDLETRRNAFQRMLEIAEREDPAYTVLHQNAIFYGKRADIAWKPSALLSMDFRAGNFAVGSSN